MKKLLFYLFILCSTSIVAQNGITFEVEQLSKPEKLYPVTSPDEIYRYLMLFDNESTIRITEKDIWKPPFNVIAKSESVYYTSGIILFSAVCIRLMQIIGRSFYLRI